MILRTLACLLALSCLGLTGCFGVKHSPGIRLATDPPGARVLLNGKDTGFMTPAFLDLRGDNARVDMELDGYQTATRLVRSTSHLSSIHWSEMELGPSTWRFPLWVDYDDFFTMWRFVTIYEPTRVFVRLRLAGEA